MFRLCPDPLLNAGPLPSAPALLHLARFRFRAFRFRPGNCSTWNIFRHPLVRPGPGSRGVGGILGN